MKTVQEALQGALGDRVGRRPTGQQVHRHTRTARGQERAFWQPIDRRARSRIVAAAERYDRVHRIGHRTARNGRANGAIGHIGLEVLRALLFDFLDPRSGRLDPAIATIASRIGRSIAAVAEALKRLRAHGFLEWLRRYVPTGQAGLRGPQVRQTSNAYRITLPAAILTALATPTPDDDDHRRATDDEAYKAMLAVLSARELVAAMLDDGPLARALATYGAMIERKERDSATKDESQQS